MKYVYEEGDYNCDKCDALGDFNGGGDDFPDGCTRVFLCGGLVDMNVEWDGDNSRDIFHDYRGCYCDDCVAEIVNNYKENK